MHNFKTGPSSDKYDLSSNFSGLVSLMNPKLKRNHERNKNEITMFSTRHKQDKLIS